MTARAEAQLRLDVAHLRRELDQAETTAELAREGQRQAEAQLQVLEARVEELTAQLRDARETVAQAVTRDVRPVPTDAHQEVARLRAKVTELEAQLQERGGDR